MASKEKKTVNKCIATDWLEEDKLMLLECWSRDGYTYQDICNKIGIAGSTLTVWKRQYPEIEAALSKGREIIDYKVENALLKSALGYHTKEVKVTTTMRYGKVVETIKETTDKEQAPNVSAIQCWLYNRLPQKWKKNRDQLIELDEEDTTIQVTVTRASSNESHQKNQPKPQPEEKSDDYVDEDWQDTINNSVTIRRATEEEQAENKRKRNQSGPKTAQNLQTKVENEAEDDDLDYWPDDWKDEDREE